MPPFGNLIAHGMNLKTGEARGRPAGLFHNQLPDRPSLVLWAWCLGVLALAPACTGPTFSRSQSPVQQSPIEELGMTTFDEQIAAGAAPANTSTLPVNIGSGRTPPVYGPPVLFGHQGGILGP